MAHLVIKWGDGTVSFIEQEEGLWMTDDDGKDVLIDEKAYAAMGEMLNMYRDDMDEKDIKALWDEEYFGKQPNTRTKEWTMRLAIFALTVAIVAGVYWVSFF